MSLFEKWKNFIESLKNLSDKDLEAYKYLFMFLIVLDLFGVYWFLELKKLGIFLLIVFIFMLTFIFIVSKPNKDKKPRQKPLKRKFNTNKRRSEKKKMPEEESEQTQESSFDLENDFSFELPNSQEDMQRRMDNALGMF